ncbi:unnamed protein product [Adineta ricciae]|uniref:Uncharacterized protein n=1 Tax=Adineta ricciae TaxID=249248 RepID=A0A814EX75_ADIRI|nr:unnamed protein product [Adineta ricciae]
MTLRDSEESRVTIFDNPKRSCTDWPCLLIFIAFLILYILFAAFVFREGSIRRFITPTDSQGRMCGVGSQRDRPYLQFFNIIKCIKYILIGARCPTPQMCVEKCPSTFYHYKLLYAQELKLILNNRDKIPQIRAQLSCEKFAQSQVKNPTISIYELVKQRQVCAPYAFPSEPLYGRCIPSIIVQTLNSTIKQANDIIQNQGGNTTDDDIIPSKHALQTSLEYFKKALQIKRLLSFMFEDLIQSRYILLLSLLFAMIILVVYMLLLRYLARWMIWVSIFLCIVVFALAATFCFMTRARMTKYSANNNNNSFVDLEEMNITFNANEFNDNSSNTIINTDETTKKASSIEKFDTAMILLEQFAPMSVVWLVLGIICCILCAIMMVCTCCLWERISLAAALIEEASKAICYALTTLLWPIITFFLNIGFIILGILVLAHYSTLGRPIYQISCTQDYGQSCQQKSPLRYLISNETNYFPFRSIPNSCVDYREGDSCTPDDFAQLNCSVDRIRCVYVSYGFTDETFTAYMDSVWSHRLAQFLSQHPWIVNIFSVFIIYWLLAFIVALEEMILACTFASYYWDMDRREKKCCNGYFHECLCLQGVSTTFRYHLGTIAFGSSIIAIIDTLRTLIDLVKDRLESVNLSNYGQCCFQLINGLLNCVRCCFQFFSRYTYIMTAVSSKWFCPSAMTATTLLIENCLRVFVLDRVCTILLYIGRITVTIGSCVFAAYILYKMDSDIHLHFSWFPVLVIGICVYISSAIFLHVYATATSTLFFCVLYDLELHDDLQMGSPRLKSILNKSNDFRQKKSKLIPDQSINENSQSKF